MDVDLPGGDFLIEVLATKPGTEKRWRELTVSELRVLGRAGGAPINPKHLPLLAIGSLDGFAKRTVATDGLPRGPFASVEALCTAWETATAPKIKAAFPGDRYPGPIDPPYCRPDTPRGGAPVTSAAQGPFRSATWLRLYEPESSATRLVLETAKGFSITGIELGRYYHDDPGCGHASFDMLEDATVIKSEIGREVVMIRTLHADAYWARGDTPGPSGVVERAFACELDVEGLASCQGPLEVGRSWGWPPGWDPTEGNIPNHLDPAKITWSKRVSPTLGPAGDLRVASGDPR